MWIKTKGVLGITQVVGIIKKWVLSSMIDTDNIMNITRKHDISVDVINEIPIREYVGKKRDKKI